MKAEIRILAALLLGFSSAQGAGPVVFFGPMCHWEFGNQGHHFTWGVEESYWKLVGSWPLGFDVGFEFGRPGYRIYTEAQAGIVAAGLAAGPVLEFGGGKGAQWGFQNSLWANAFLGGDFRWRRVGGMTYHCPGTYLKVPVVTEGIDEYNANTESTHHHHFWHWDD